MAYGSEQRFKATPGCQKKQQKSRDGRPVKLTKNRRVTKKENPCPVKDGAEDVQKKGDNEKKKIPGRNGVPESSLNGPPKGTPVKQRKSYKDP